MTKIICIAGLPGSGKSTLAKQIVKENPSFALYDDASSSLKEEEPKGDMIVIDVNFCDAQSRMGAEMWFRLTCNADVQWIFFENNPQQCLANMIARQETGDLRSVRGTIERFKHTYQPPEGADVRPVYSR